MVVVDARVDDGDPDAAAESPSSLCAMSAPVCFSAVIRSMSLPG